MLQNSLPEGAPAGLTIEQLSDDATLQEAAKQYVKLVLGAGNSVAQVGAAIARCSPHSRHLPGQDSNQRASAARPQRAPRV